MKNIFKINTVIKFDSREFDVKQVFLFNGEEIEDFNKIDLGKKGYIVGTHPAFNISCYLKIEKDFDKGKPYITFKPSFSYIKLVLPNGNTKRISLPDTKMELTGDAAKEPQKRFEFLLEEFEKFRKEQEKFYQLSCQQYDKNMEIN